jgi:RimK family alpha-L-glutamate ligase
MTLADGDIVAKSATVLLIGDAVKDRSGHQFASAFRRSGVEVRWITMRELLMQLRIGDVTLAMLFEQGVFAHSIDVDDIAVDEDCVLSCVTYVVVVNAQEHDAFIDVVTEVCDRQGLLFPNTIESARLARNKWRTFETFTKYEVATPLCVLSASNEHAVESAAELGYPVVVKDPWGSGGRGVWLVADQSELEALLRDELSVEQEPMLIQQYIECGAMDKRLLFVDGEFCAAFVCHAKDGDFRSNLAQGGTMLACEVTEAELDLGKAVVAAIGLRFAGLDICTVVDNRPKREYLRVGQPFCLEANSMPGISHFPRLCGVDPAVDVVAMMLRVRPPDVISS